MYSMWTKVTSQLWQVVFVNFSGEPIIYWPKSWKNGFIRVINNSKMVKSRVMVSRIVYWERSEQIMGIWLNKLSHFLQIVINNLLTHIYKLLTRRKGGADSVWPLLSCQTLWTIDCIIYVITTCFLTWQQTLYRLQWLSSR